MNSLFRCFATRSTPHVGLVVLTLAVFPAAPSQGQARLLTRVLDSSTVVRVHFAEGGSEEGSLLAPFGPTSSTLSYCSLLAPRCTPREGVRARVLAETISRLEVQNGTRTGRGFLIGTAVVGVVVVPFLQLAPGGEGETRGSLLAKGVLVSALIGGGLGAAIGHGHLTWGPAP